MGKNIRREIWETVILRVDELNLEEKSELYKRAFTVMTDDCPLEYKLKSVRDVWGDVQTKAELRRRGKA